VKEALDLALEIFGLAAAGALVASLAVAWMARRITPARASGYYIAPCAVAIGFFAGYVVLPREWAALIPDPNQRWQWLPYGGLMAALFAVGCPPAPKSQAWRFAVIAAAPIAAYYLTPNWPVFGLPQQQLRWALVMYLLLVGVPLQYLPARLLDQELLAAMAAAAALTAVATGAMVSSKLAQLAAIAAGGLAGSWIAGLLGGKRGQLPGQSVVSVYAVLVGGIAWLACVEPDPPKLALLAIPLAPLALWIVCLADMWRPSGPKNRK